MKPAPKHYTSRPVFHCSSMSAVLHFVSNSGEAPNLSRLDVCFVNPPNLGSCLVSKKNVHQKTLAISSCSHSFVLLLPTRISRLGSTFRMAYSRVTGLPVRTLSAKTRNARAKRRDGPGLGQPPEITGDYIGIRRLLHVILKG